MPDRTNFRANAKGFSMRKSRVFQRKESGCVRSGNRLDAAIGFNIVVNGLACAERFGAVLSSLALFAAMSCGASA